MFFEEDFFREEVLCGFTVPVMMKRAWAAQIEVFLVVADICRRNGIHYFADGGTLLGAVRHKGYIPWDDDIDLCIRRDEFQKLIELLPGELPKGFDIKGIHAPKPSGYPAFDDTNQLCVVADRRMWNWNEYIRYFHGYPFDVVAIDIFPLDYVPRDRELLEIQQEIIKIAAMIIGNWAALQKTGGLDKRLKALEEISGIKLPPDNTKFYIRRLIDAVSALYTEEESDTLYEYCFPDVREYDPAIKKELYDEVIWMPFENIEMPVPAGYDTILTSYYGNYKEFAPNTSMHNYPFYEEMMTKLSQELVRAGVSYSVEELCEKVLRGEVEMV